MRTEPSEPPFSLEVPYQVIVVAAVLSAFMIAVLMPREPGDSPGVFAYVVAVHAVALTATALLIANRPFREAAPAIVGWSLLLVAPDLWAHALVAPLGLAFQPFVTLTLYALAVQTLAHFRLWAGLALVGLGLASLAAGEPFNLGLQALGSGYPTWALLGAALTALAVVPARALARAGRRP
ncbi:MAG TPA: hypothetical protein VHN99_09625 [Deinococcales bacterium]|nr:hypothetical protein [Deinococcales bacterium]